MWVKSGNQADTRTRSFQLWDFNPVHAFLV